MINKTIDTLERAIKNFEASRNVLLANVDNLDRKIEQLKKTIKALEEQGEESQFEGFEDI